MKEHALDVAAGMPTPEEIRLATSTWTESVRARLHVPTMRAGADMARMLERIAAAQEAATRRATIETYTPRGLPRNAAARARKHGAKIHHQPGAGSFRVIFPNGSNVWARAADDASMRYATAGRIIDRRDGAAPGCKPPEGRLLVDVLNAFADAEEGLV